jgi:hypothetical protein
MSVRVQCGCGKRLSARDELAGKRVKCPSCGQPVTVPSVAREHRPAESRSLPDNPDPSGQETGTLWVVLWTVWVFLTVLAGVLLVIDVRATRAECNVWGMSGPPPGGAFTTYGKVSDERLYANMHEFVDERDGRTRYCTSVTHGRPPFIETTVYGRRGTVVIRFKSGGLIGPPIDLRGPFEDVRDYWTLSKKPIPVAFVVLLALGGGFLTGRIISKRKREAKGAQAAPERGEALDRPLP